jgi:hypothetical protein
MIQSDIISVRLAGGLGNQLFQYAAGRAVSLRNKCCLKFDLSRLQDPGFKTNRSYMLGVMNIDADIIDCTDDSNLTEYIEKSYCYDSEFTKLAAGTRLTGYFQSELYFAPFRRFLREELRLSVPVSAAFTSLAGAIKTAEYPVSIHVRRGDFVSDPGTRAFHGICGFNYYQKAIKIIDSFSTARPSYFVFSDDRAEAMRMFAAIRMFASLKSVTFAETPIDRPWEDLFLMAQCRDNILANSSLSWWASWLNSHRAKTTIAPRRWMSLRAMRSSNTCDLYLDGTIII